MPPRFAYWTILIDGAPTAFRARDPQELLPTLNQLKRKNANVEMRWFARGRLWESMEQEHEDFRRIKIQEKRSSDWRPGGDHKDPRARFDKEKHRRDRREQRAERNQPAAGRPQSERPWKPKPKGDRPWPKSDRPWTGKKPAVARGFRPAKPHGDRPWSDRPPRPKGDRPWAGKPSNQSPGSGRHDRPWKPKSDRTWSGKPNQSTAGGRQDRPWRPKGPRPFRPWKPKPHDDRPKKRDDES